MLIQALKTSNLLCIGTPSIDIAHKKTYLWTSI